MKCHSIPSTVPRRTLLLITSFAVATAACGSPAKPVSDPRGLISRATIERSNAATAYELVARMLNRPLEDGVRGGPLSLQHPQTPLVLIDGVRSEVLALHQVRSAEVDSIEILQGPEATQRYGTGAAKGAILVATSNRPVLVTGLNRGS